MPHGRIAEIEQLADYAMGFTDTEAFLSELMLVQSFSAEEVVAAEDPAWLDALSRHHRRRSTSKPLASTRGRTSAAA